MDAASTLAAIESVAAMATRFKTPRWAATPSRALRFAVLRVRKDGETVDELRVGRQACYVLGRNEDVCDYGMQHPSISRQHAAIVHDKQGRIHVLDLGSAQGTFVNGEEIEPDAPRALSDGDRITFGASTRTYIFESLTRTEEEEKEKETAAAAGEADVPRSQPNAISDTEMMMMQQLPTGFGGKHGRARAEASRSSQGAADARKKREAEIAAMTAQMMNEPAQLVRKPLERDAGSENHEDASDHHRLDGERAPESEGDDPVGKEDEEDDNEEDEEDDEVADVARRYNLPMSHEVGLVSHSKAVSCIAVDAPGARVATGSTDYRVKLWDFAGMARRVRPFREVEVDEGHPLVAVSYSPSGDRLLAATGASHAKILSREGVTELQTATGDMYVVDMAHTNGHTHAVTGGMWHPERRDEMITSSLDGTVRIWSLEGKRSFDKLVNTAVLKFKSKRGKRGAVTACRYNLDGSLVAAGLMDGQLQFVDPRRAYAGPSVTIRDAHADGGGDVGISSVKFSPDGRLLASRSCADDSIKIWDVRKMRDCVKRFSDVEGVFGTSNLAFNVAGTSIAAGTCVRKGKGLSGRVVFLDVHSPSLVDPIASVDMQEDESAVCVEWHAGINQVFVGSSTGACRVLYDPQLSRKGVMLSATKKLKVAADFAARIDSAGDVHNPHALPMYRDEVSRKRKLAVTRADPKRSKAPEKPLSGPGMGGKISGSASFTQYFMSSHVKKSSFREEDPREAILKFAKTAEAAPQFAGAAYSGSQPTGKLDPRYALAARTLEEEQVAEEEEKRRLLQP